MLCYNITFRKHDSVNLLLSECACHAHNHYHHHEHNHIPGISEMVPQHSPLRSYYTFRINSHRDGMAGPGTGDKTMATKQITFYISGDKATPAAINIRATGDTYRIKDEFKARGFVFGADGWEKTQPVATSKPDADWVKSVANCQVFVGGRLMHTGA